MKDTIIKALALNNHIRIIACTTTNLCEKARLQHDLWPTSAAAMGRTLSATAMMGSMLKDDREKITVSINGNGPIGTIMAESFKNGNVRGFVGDNQQFLQYNDTNKLAVGLIVGKDGYLRVIKDLGLKEKFEGKVALVSGEIAEDFAYYFTVSEQTPSAVSLGVLVDTDNSVIAAGGLIIQVMPNATDSEISAVEKVVSNLMPISSLIEKGMDASAIVKSLFEEVNILEESELNWFCNCHKDRFKAALTTLGNDDLLDMKDNEHGCEVKCEFCNTTYKFDENDLQLILDFKKTCGK